MKSVRKIVDGVLDWILVALFIVIFAVVLMQIVYRYGLRSPLVWSEELSRFIFIWVSLLGWTVATRNGTHIAITFFKERLPRTVQTSLDVLFKLITVGFLGVLTYLGYEMAARTMGRGAVTIPSIPMGVVYASLPVSAALGILYILLDAIAPRAKPAPAAAGTAGKDTI